MVAWLPSSVTMSMLSEVVRAAHNRMHHMARSSSALGRNGSCGRLINRGDNRMVKNDVFAGQFKHNGLSCGPACDVHPCFTFVWQLTTTCSARCHCHAPWRQLRGRHCECTPRDNRKTHCSNAARLPSANPLMMQWSITSAWLSAKPKWC